MSEENNIKDKVTVFCKICQKMTIYSPKVFFGIHVKSEHNITTQEYYDKFEKKEGEGICKVCKGHTKFIKFSQGYRDYCSPKCTQKDKEVRNKIESTNLERYGTKHSSLNEDVINKKKATNLERFGSEHFLTSLQYLSNAIPLTEEQIKLKIERSKETCLARYGVDNGFKLDKVKGINKKYNRERFDSILPDNYKLIEYNSYKEKHKILCPKKHEFESTYYFLNRRKNNGAEICTVCNPPYSISESSFQIDVRTFIQKNYDGVVICNDRTIISPLELDIFIPELNLAFECNGIYWHNELHVEPYLHQFKTNICEKNKIKLIHIYEDDWNFKGDIVESRILNAIRKTDRKIYARNCDIRDVSYDDSRDFLNTNHIQGNCASLYRFGLYIGDELISLMTFGNLRVNMNVDRTDKTKFELLRFCNKIGCGVAGGASKLFKHFISNYEFSSIISYADRSWSQGELYETLGFNFIKNTIKNYWYVVDNKRVNRFNFRKDVLVSEGFDPNKSEREIMLDRGIYRIYDSGSKLYMYTKNKKL